MTRHLTAKLSVAALCLAATPSLADPRLDGVWVSDGYGMVSVIAGSRVQSYEVAGATCVDAGTDNLNDILSNFTVSLALDGSGIYLQWPGMPHRIWFDRASDVPAACAAPRPDTPEGNFEAFADIFAAHYGFFDLYGVEWPSVVASARAGVTPATTEVELFETFSQMIAPLQDGHVDITARIGRDRYFYEPFPGATNAALAAQATANGMTFDAAESAFQQAFWIGNVQTQILGGVGEVAGHQFVQYGMAAPDVGYLALVTEAGYATGSEDAPQEDLAEINAILDDAMALFAQGNARAVIVDLSVNYGGYDMISVAIAERFAQTETFAYSKYAADAVTPIVTRQYITPSERPGFAGPVYLITSDITVSAGEILTLALRALPQTVHLGQPTRGALSDVLDKDLPNGWTISLSNEVYTDHDGIVWEGRGIQPDHLIDVFPAEDMAGGHLAAVMLVLAMIP